MPVLTDGLPRLAVCMGDPAGIGPEVTAKALADGALDGLAHPVLIGSRQALEKTGVSLPFTPYPATGKSEISFIETGGPLPALGAPSADGGRHAIGALDTAVRMALAGEVAGMVTAPLSKQAVRMAGKETFTGHTEYLAGAAKATPVRMMMHSEPLTVVLVTTHHALEDLPGLIDTARVLDTIRLTHAALVRHQGIANPRIAVCGLNPHPGEFGAEDAAIVTPAVEAARAEGIAADGPFSADALFGRVVHGRTHDAVVAMYHDQGLIPVKLLARGAAVNITLGLPFVRTSPAHGTGFDLAGKGRADATGMKAAMIIAARWARPGTQKIASEAKG